MCNNCIHQPVCSKFAATGGHVNKCEHWVNENILYEIEKYQRMLDQAYEIIGKMTDRYC